MCRAATSPASSGRCPGRERVLPVLGVLLALALIVHGPIPQWAAYHAFADRRALFGLPNAADVLSSLPFGMIGLWALWTSSGRPIREASLA